VLKKTNYLANIQNKVVIIKIEHLMTCNNYMKTTGS